MPKGPCLEVGGETSRAESNHRRRFVVGRDVDRQWLGGAPVDIRELNEALRSARASQPAIDRARRLRLAGWTLMGAGVTGTVTTAVALAADRRGQQTTEGLGAMALAGVGALLLYLGKRSETQAVRSFNRQAFESGACLVPR
jgi:hypothetical protein